MIIRTLRKTTVVCEAGTVIDVPASYAAALIKRGAAEQTEQVAEPPATKKKPAKEKKGG